MLLEVVSGIVREVRTDVEKLVSSVEAKVGGR